jgi:F-type H+-transporting ATPase subunit b
MPQIDQISATYVSQLFWLLLTFGLTYVIIGRGMFSKIQSTVDARDQRIAADLEAARLANDGADGLEEQYRATLANERAEAQSLVAQAKVGAAKQAEAARHAADAAIAEKIAGAEAAIAAQAQAAMDEISNVAAEAASDIVAKLGGQVPSADIALTEVKAVLHG